MFYYRKKNEIIKKTLYNELVKKVNALITSGLVKNQVMMLRSMILKVKYVLLLT